MVFFRIKRIKGKEYAYLVENKWKKGAKQKVIGYIGRVYSFESKTSTDFLSFKKAANIEEYVKNNEKNRIIADLIEWEFFKHSIDKNEFLFDFADIKLIRKNKNVCVKINEGYLCGLTLTNILNFRALADETDEQTGARLARAFIDAGINIPQEVFVGFFEGIIKADEKPSPFEGFYY